MKLRIKHLRGDHSHIRHASLLGFSNEQAGLLVYRKRLVLRLRMVKHLAEIAHVELLSA
ncbi:hypothetical protein LRP31_21050 [Mesorhizobium mediterraneum]|uniref:hypothetical protein n=1 Tax=Mesorhizobium TaxID=68287 RepID=UPI0013051D1E|nr:MULTISPECIES: hypothetical protein [Mesorhizobium]WIW51557.1 hypothetical protein LRP31_21050 [Mesorhizobium mediterraneum]